MSNQNQDVMEQVLKTLEDIQKNQVELGAKQDRLAQKVELTSNEKNNTAESGDAVDKVLSKAKSYAKWIVGTGIGVAVGVIYLIIQVRGFEGDLKAESKSIRTHIDSKYNALEKHILTIEKSQLQGKEDYNEIRLTLDRLGLDSRWLYYIQFDPTKTKEQKDKIISDSLRKFFIQRQILNYNSTRKG